MPTTSAAVVSKWLGIPFSFTAHAWDIFVRNPSLRAKIRLAQRVITCTDYNRWYLQALCPEASGRIMLNYHGVDLERFLPTGRMLVAGSWKLEQSGKSGGKLEAGTWKLDERVPASSLQPPASDSTNPLVPASSFQPLASDHVSLLSVGRLVSTKGYGTLITAYGLLKERGLAFRAVVVGQGPLKGALERQIRGLGLQGRVDLLPAMGQEELRALYSQARAFVLPSEVAPNGDRDGIPNVILEASAMGLPVVSTDISGIPEAVQDRATGRLIEPGNAEALADVLQEFIEDPGYASSLGAAARRFVEQTFDARMHMASLVAVMRQLVSNKRQATSNKQPGWDKGQGTGDKSEAVVDGTDGTDGIDGTDDFASSFQPQASDQGKPVEPLPPPPAPRPAPLRVMYVIWSLGLGGAEQVVIRLAKGLDRSRFEPLIVCLNDPGPFADEAREQDIEVIALDKRGPFDLGVVGKLTRLMRDRKVSVVHTHLWGANLWGRIAANRVGIPVVATEHNMDVWKRRRHFALDRVLAPRTAQLVAVSDQVRRFYEERGVGRGAWVVIYNGVQLINIGRREAGSLKLEAGTNASGKSAIRNPQSAIRIGDGPVVGWIGRLVPAKRPVDFITAVADARKEIPELRGLVIGDGPERGAVEAAIRQLGLEESVTLAGMRQDVPDMLARLSALVFTSEREGLSMAMLEAMAAGVPVIATRVGGTPELIEDNVTGLLVDPGNPGASAARIVELIRDSQKRVAIADAARQRLVERFSLERMVERHQALYQSAVQRIADCGLRIADFPDALVPSSSLQPPASDSTNPLVPASSFQLQASDQVTYGGRETSHGPRPIRVAHVIDSLGLGGAQRQLVELVKALPKDRYEVSIISLSDEKREFEAELAAHGIHFTVLTHRGAWSWRTLGQVLKLIREARPDIVHTWLFTAGLYGRIAAKLAGVRLVVHAVRSIEPDKPGLYVVADRVLRWTTSAYVANAEAVGHVLLRRERVRKEAIAVCYNGVDLLRFTPETHNGALRKELNWSAEELIVGMVGRLEPVKDHGTFLRAAKLVIEKQPSVKFLCVGSGPLRAGLETLIRGLGIESNIRMIEKRSAAAAISAMDVVVVPSIYEGCSNVILEAMAMGKPVIASQVGGNPELVQGGSTGMLFPVGDARALAAAIFALAKDEESRRRMSEAALVLVRKHFTLGAMVVRTEAVYQNLMQRLRGRSVLNTEAKHVE